MRGVTRVDVAVATAFVVVAVVEAVVVHGSDPGLRALGCAGAPVLAVLALRRRHPAVTVVVVAGFAIVGTLLQTLWRPDASDNPGVWIFALMLACYSLGSHATGRLLVLGAAAPLLVVMTADLPTMTGWEMTSGIVFVTLFVGVLPTAVGVVVRRRRAALDGLAEQRLRIIEGLRSEGRTAILAERVRADERLRPALLDGLRDLARQAENGTGAATIEAEARELLGRTRREVLALTAPVEDPGEPLPPTRDHGHLPALRAAAQPWTVVVAGALGVGLALESTQVLPLEVADSVAVGASFLVAVPVAMLCWRPLPALAVAWCATAVFSHAVAPLDGTLSGAAVAIALAFGVAVLSTRRGALAGLAVCWLGEALSVGANDVVGVGALLLAFWLGGVAVNEATDLVDRSRVNNGRLAEQAEAEARRSLVQERLRLARELHDVLGHTLTVVALQAGAARRIEDTDPVRAGEFRTTIAAAAHDGLAVLHGREESTGDLRALLDRTRAAGLAIDVDLAALDDLAQVDAATRHVAERVLQESLTNVLRHAPGARAQVRVRRTPGAVDVVVTNTRSSTSGAGPGSSRGLAGIRERVTALAGTVVWGPDHHGGFEVRAHLPLSTVTGAVR